MRRLAARWLAAFALALTGCGDATGNVEGGGDRFDAAAPNTPAPANDEICGANGPSGSGTTFTDLYRDVFGPTGGASCAKFGTCHGAADQTGAQVSRGFVCDSQAGCRATMFTANPPLVKPADFPSPQTSLLIQTLRHRTADGTLVGIMPDQPKCVLSQDAIARIQTWISGGALDN